jgi:hypothetical protein
MVAKKRSIYRLSEDTGVAWQTADAYIAGVIPKNPSHDVARKISAWTNGEVSVAQIVGLASEAA